MAKFMLWCLLLAPAISNVFTAPFDHIWTHVKRTSDPNSPTKRCRSMQNAVETVIDDFVEATQMTDMFEMTIHHKGGVTEEEAEMVKMHALPIACAIADVHSLESLAKVIQAPVDSVRLAYGMLKYYISIMGSSPAEIMKTHIEMADFVMQELESGGFPQWPLQASKEEIAIYVGEIMPLVFGNNWIRILFLDPTAPAADQLDSDAIDSIAQTLSEANSLREASPVIGTLLSHRRMPSHVELVFADIFEELSTNHELRVLVKTIKEEVITVLELAESYGLFDLEGSSNGPPPPPGASPYSPGP